MSPQPKRHPWHHTAQTTTSLLAPVLWTVCGTTALITVLGVAVGVDPAETATTFLPKTIEAVWPVAKLLIALWAIIAVSDFIRQIDLREALHYAGWKHDRLSTPYAAPAYALTAPAATATVKAGSPASTHTPDLGWRHGRHPPLVYEDADSANKMTTQHSKRGML